jgi:hypothetical protein
MEEICDGEDCENRYIILIEIGILICLLKFSLLNLDSDLFKLLIFFLSEFAINGNNTVPIPWDPIDKPDVRYERRRDGSEIRRMG